MMMRRVGVSEWVGGCRALTKDVGIRGKCYYNQNHDKISTAIYIWGYN